MLAIPIDGPLTRAFAPSSGTTPSAASSSPHRHPLSSWLQQTSSTTRCDSSSSDRPTPVTVYNAMPVPALKPNYLQQNLASVARSLRVILSPNERDPRSDTGGVLVSYEDLYAKVECLVHVCKAGAELYERVQMEIERGSVEFGRVLKNQIQQGHQIDRQWLEGLSRAWAGWAERSNIVRNILAPLDSGFSYKQRAQHFQSSQETLLEAFKHNVIDDPEIRQKAVESIVAIVDEERSAPSSSSGPSYRDALHSSLLTLLIRTQAYDDFEAAILTATQAYYDNEASRFVSDNSAVETTPSAASMDDYLKHTQLRIDQETLRGQWLLAPTSDGKKKMVEITRHELVKQKADWLTAGLPAFLQEEKPPLTSVSLLYKHLSSVGHFKPLTTILFDHILEVGTAIVSPPSVAALSKLPKPPKTEADKESLRQGLAEEEAIIERLLAFKSKIDATVEQAFAGQAEFLQRRTEGFEKVVNSRTGGGKVAELCAKYLDAKLKSGNRTMSDEELERCLDEALALFRYTHAKDMFEEFYKRHFAKRLLLNRSASSDAEQSMLLKLKEECGAGFTQALETMLKDITLSDEMMKGYATQQEKLKTDTQGQGGDDFDLNANVLTQAHWPTYPIVSVTIPANMAAALERFRTFYSARNSGRKLHWAHSLSTCVIKATFPKCGEKELHVSEFQALVLLLFNSLGSAERLSYESIREQTGLEDFELRRTLQSLACGQIPTRVLRKEPQGKEVHDSDLFYFNESLKNERHRIRINQIQMKETVEEQASTESKVLLDRGLVLQAAAVRILKARKQLKHAELLQDVVEAIKTRFQVDVGEIKKTFEILIEKEYMERVEGERGVYRYLA